MNIKIRNKRIISRFLLAMPIIPIFVFSSSSEIASETQIPKIGTWYKPEGSKITDGYTGTIFQAKNGDLYAMGSGTGLEVLKNGASSFELAKGSTISNGENGTIFQAKNGDIYAMAKDAPLQVLKNDASAFTLAKGSITKNGHNGQIFQARNGDIYVMGSSTGLEVLKNGTSTFTLAKGSIIKDGYAGTIFQARNGDIYAMGYRTGLEVLKNGGSMFTLAKGSITKDGYDGTIFQARNGDLYVMGNTTSLEVLKNDGSMFTLAKGSITKDGYRGTIFQARNEDLYVMGYRTGLEVLKNGASRFTLAPGSKITSGEQGTIFQSRNGDLYAMGHEDAPQVLKNGASRFTSITGSKLAWGQNGTFFQARNGDLYLLGYNEELMVMKNGESRFRFVTGLEFYSGEHAVIFQAKNGDIYVMGNETGLEVLKNNDLKFTIKNESLVGLNNGSIEIANFQNQYSKLQYKKNDDEWNDISLNGKINNLGKGKYAFRWKAKINGHKYKQTNSDTQNIEQQIWLGYRINAPIRPSFRSNDETIKGRNDGSITSNIFESVYSQLQYKKKESREWINWPLTKIVSNLSPGKYQFRWKSKNYQIYNGEISDVALIPGEQEIMPGIVLEKPLDPTFITTETSIEGNDGSIILISFHSSYSQLQYKKIGAIDWIDFPSSRELKSLIPGDYQFQWKSKNGEKYHEINSEIKQIKGFQKIIRGKKLGIPNLPTFNPVDELGRGQNNGMIRVTNFDITDSKLQYTISGANNWKDVSLNGQIKNLGPGQYQFQWKSKLKNKYLETNGDTLPIANKVTILSHDLKILKNVIQELNSNALDGLADSSSLPNTIIWQDVLDAIKNLDAIRTLDEQQKELLSLKDIILIPGDDGTLKIRIQNYGPNKDFLVRNFQTRMQFNSRKLNDNKKFFEDFEQFVNNWPSPISDGKIDASDLSTLDGHKDIPPTTHDVIRTFSINTNLNTGIAIVTITFISGSGENKVTNTIDYKINGFQTTRQANEKVLLDAISLLGSNILDHLANENILPSSISKETIFNAIKNLESIKKLTINQVRLLREDYTIGITSDDVNGRLQVTIQNNKENMNKIFTINGFQTMRQADERILLNTINSLDSIALTPLLANKDVLPSSVNFETTFDAIQNLKSVKKLTINQIEILRRDYTIGITSDDVNGRLQVTIQNNKENMNKIFTINGFQTTNKVALARAFNSLGSRELNHLASKDVLPSSITIETLFNAIQNLRSIKELTNSQKKLFTKNDIDLLINDNKGTLEVIIKNQKPHKIFKISGFLSLKKATNKTNKKDRSLSTIQIVGITMGSIIGTMIFGYLIYQFIKGNKSMKR